MPTTQIKNVRKLPRMKRNWPLTALHGRRQQFPLMSLLNINRLFQQKGLRSLNTWSKQLIIICRCKSVCSWKIVYFNSPFTIQKLYLEDVCQKSHRHNISAKVQFIRLAYDICFLSSNCNGLKCLCSDNCPTIYNPLHYYNYIFFFSLAVIKSRIKEPKLCL